ncbi:hypothetical protein WJX81_007580 [Elliptochloris bilobata]|uniref:Uncharacterized protein n=1 Tax=Elliptochloris bilobata TaxID=381761 RepID=A0AAW1SE57_9CHLO
MVDLAAMLSWLRLHLHEAEVLLALDCLYVKGPPVMPGLRHLVLEQAGEVQQDLLDDIGFYTSLRTVHLEDTWREDED